MLNFGSSNIWRSFRGRKLDSLGYKMIFVFFLVLFFFYIYIIKYWRYKYYVTLLYYKNIWIPCSCSFLRQTNNVSFMQNVNRIQNFDVNLLLLILLLLFPLSPPLVFFLLFISIPFGRGSFEMGTLFSCHIWQQHVGQFDEMSEQTKWRLTIFES